MLSEVSEERFYTESSSLFRLARGPAEMTLASKTPTLLSCRELSTTARREYRQQFVRSVTDARLRPVYCFAWSPTVALLECLFSANEDVRAEQLEQLLEVRSLVDQGILDLRWSPTIAFPSGIASPKVTMIHRKDPTGLITVAVDLATDSDARKLSGPLVDFTKRLNRVDDETFGRLVEGARHRCFRQRMLSHVGTALARADAELAELCRVEATIKRVLNLGTQPDQGHLSSVVKSLHPDRSNASRSLLTRLIASAVEECRAIGDPVSAILTDSSTTVALPSSASKLFFRTEVPPDCPDGKRVRLTYPVLLLEACLTSPQQSFHPADGLFVFAKWRAGGVSDLYRRTDQLCRQLRMDLGKISPSLETIFRSGDEAETVLVSTNFGSDVADAVRRLAEARPRLKQNDIGSTESELLDLLRDFACLPEAAVLLVTCWTSRREAPTERLHQDFLQAAEMLDLAVQTHRRGLKAIRRQLSLSDPGVRSVLRRRELVLKRFESALGLVESWLDDDGEYLRGKRELRQLINLLQRISSPDLQEHEQFDAYEKLMTSPFGAAVHGRLAFLLRKREESFREILVLATPQVLSKPFSSVVELEDHLVGNVRRRLQKQAHPTVVRRDRDIRHLREAEEALQQELGGRVPLDEDLCRHLGWTKDRLLNVRAIQHTVTFEDYMSDDAKATW